MTEYQYGQKADCAAHWINTQESEAQKAESRKAAARIMATRAGGEAEQYVDKISKSHDFTYDMGMQMNGPEGYSRYHNCTLTYRIWTTYSKEKDCDVYCVTQSVTSYNQNLNTCTVEQAWVWTVAGSKSQTVTIQPTFLLQDDWLTYDRAFSHIGEAYAHYISIGKTRTVTPIIINCPPRYIQTWSMSVTSDAEGADVTKIKNYLTEQLKQYFLSSSVFYTNKPDHMKSYNEGKKVEEYDEIGRFVYVSKDAFTQNKNVKEILKEAGKVGGVPDTGSYKIVWRQTDSGINSDSEDFTFNMQ
jgi:hypothetical protein